MTHKHCERHLGRREFLAGAAVDAGKHGLVTWDEMIKANEKLGPDLGRLEA